MRTRFIGFLILLTAFACKTEVNNKKTIIAFGDSNGAREHSWVYHFQKLIGNDTVLNYCISGNTIGFNNLDRDELNTLKNVNKNLNHADSVSEKIDQILILLGTNDCKAVFKDRQNEVPLNMQKLINNIREFNYKQKKAPQIVIISPPPFAHDSLLIEKYIGGDERVKNLVGEFSKIAKENNLKYIDIYHPLKPDFNELNEDGVHLNQKGYDKMAKLIYDGLYK